MQISSQKRHAAITVKQSGNQLLAQKSLGRLKPYLNNLEFEMTLIQELMNQSATTSMLQDGLIKRFSPLEIRETIQTLVATEQIDMAYALGEAGLAIYPQSEDMLAICGLLAVMRQDWPAAVELLQELVELQGANIQPFTYVMLVRALRCNLDPAGALKMVNQGLHYYPGQLELVAERLALEEYVDAITPSSHTH